jgi:hypothetical protein
MIATSSPSTAPPPANPRYCQISPKKNPAPSLNGTDPPANGPTSTVSRQATAIAAPRSAANRGSGYRTAQRYPAAAMTSATRPMPISPSVICLLSLLGASCHTMNRVTALIAKSIPVRMATGCHLSRIVLLTST